jgi:hypothetical protein
MSLESTFIKIVSCKNSDFWYKNKIGQTFQVTSPERKGSPPFKGSIAVDVSFNEFGFSYVDEGDFVFMNKPYLFSRYNILKMENSGNN